MRAKWVAGMTAMRPAHGAALLLVNACLFAQQAVASDGARDAEVAALTAAILAIDADPAYGEYLAGDCVTCHRAAGSAGIPPIAGLPADYLATALVEYRLGVRDNDVMVTRAAALGDEEIAALAAHFSSQPH